MADIPQSLVYYGTFQGVLQILEHQTLPLFQAEDIPDPFLPNGLTELDFDCQALFERTVKYMTSAILGKGAPRGNPSHPLQKAIRRWRSENRFNDEAEIRESLVGLLPAMVEQSHNRASEIHADWRSFVLKKRLLPFFQNNTDIMLWLLEADRHAGAAIKFKCEEGSVFDHVQPVAYSKIPPKPVKISDCVDVMVGDSQEMPEDFLKLLLTQDYRFRSQKEWRLMVDSSAENEVGLDFPRSLIQSVYVGAGVAKEKAEQLFTRVKQLDDKINLFQATCGDTNYDLQFEKQNDEDE